MRRNIDPRGATPIRVFEAATPAGTSQEFRASGKATCIVSVPAAMMRPEIQDTTTPIELRITRARPRAEKSNILLPEPLADPLQDIRVNRATPRPMSSRPANTSRSSTSPAASAPTSSAFPPASWTRAASCRSTRRRRAASPAWAIPTPGLPAKAFDQDMEPLVEIVQDTVGRHDAFALACYAKFYEDMGYPGHVNCSDNFNGALDPYGVAARRGLDGAELLLQHRHRRE